MNQMNQRGATVPSDTLDHAALSADSLTTRMSSEPGDRNVTTTHRCAMKAHRAPFIFPFSASA